MSVRPDELIRRPHPRLRPFVGDYVGYDIFGVAAGTHLGLPSGALTFIVSIDAPLTQVEAGTGSAASFDVLLAGLHLRPTHIRHSGAMAGIQINFTPFAPRALFGMPAAEFAHRTYDLVEVSRTIAAELHDRVNSALTWDARFNAVDEVLLRTAAEAGPRPAPPRGSAGPRPELLEAWKQIAAGHGGLPISLVADQIGWSRRHLNAVFSAEFGIGPKEAARVLRFDRARRLISAQAGSLAEISAVCGYADQSHLNRDFRRLAETTPGRWLQDDPVARRGTVGSERTV